VQKKEVIMMSEQDKFYSFDFFCPKFKEREALRVLKRRRDVSLYPFPSRAVKGIAYTDGRGRTIEGSIISGICLRSRLPKILERLQQRRVAAFNDESIVRIASLPDIGTLKLKPDTTEDPRIRRN
jgi:hypothetical protein